MVAGGPALFGHEVAQERVEVDGPLDGAPAPLCLGRPDLQPPLDGGDRPTDRDGRPGEVQIAHLEPEHLGPAQRESCKVGNRCVLVGKSIGQPVDVLPRDLGALFAIKGVGDAVDAVAGRVSSELALGRKGEERRQAPVVRPHCLGLPPGVEPLVDEPLDVVRPNVAHPARAQPFARSTALGQEPRPSEGAIPGDGGRPSITLQPRPDDLGPHWVPGRGEDAVRTSTHPNRPFAVRLTYVGRGVISSRTLSRMTALVSASSKVGMSFT